MQIRCPHCQVPFESAGDPSWTDIICPSCDNSFSLLGATSTRTYSHGTKVLGRFELLHEVGSGRFGSVWKARDTRLQRTVAIKIPRQRNLTEQETELFLRDARAAAQLHHAGIAGVHEVGREDDTLYIVADFIDGANLNEWLGGKRLNNFEAAALVRKIAEALHHAHEAGVIHRDVKPGNIMLDRHGEPYVIDFGLARREVGEVTMTMEGQILGTPAYMSPEQAYGEGHQADRRSDIYSLGVVLFKLITGELPFRGEVRMLLLQIVNDEPPSPRALNADVPLDLETITLKCLEKDPAKRYQTARDLAEDLTSFLEGKPINARPVGRIERMWRWCKRHPELASVSALLLLLLVAVSIVAPIVAVHESHLRRESELRSKELQTQVAQNLFQRACEEAGSGRASRGIALLAAAYKLTDSDSQLNDSIRSLLPGWAIQCGQPLLHDGAVLSVAFSPDGHAALTAGHDHAAHLWDVRTMLPIGHSLKHPDSVRTAAFSPSGLLAFTGGRDQIGRLWDLNTGICVGESFRDTDQILAGTFSPDGKIIAVAGSSNTVRLWSATSGTSLGTALSHPMKVLAVCFSPDGKRLLTGCFDGTARLWEVDSQSLLQNTIRVGTPIYAVAFSPDGRKILTGSASKSAQIWDAQSLQPIGEALRHDHSVSAVAWSSDGREIITGSFDRTARLWSAGTQKSIGEPLRHDDWVMSVAFSPNGRSVMTGSSDRVARLWRIGGNHNTSKWSYTNTAPMPDDETSAHFKIAAQLALSCNPFGLAFVFSPLIFDPLSNVLATSPDGSTVLLRQADDAAQIFDVRNQRLRGDPIHHDARLRAAAFAADGDTLVTGGQDQHLRLWAVENGRPIRSILHGGIVRTVAFSHHGRSMISGSSDQTAVIWNAQTGAREGEPMQHSSELRKVAFSPDDRMVLTICSDGSAWLWEARSCKLIGRPLEYETEISGATASATDATFNFDGSAILFQCADGIVRPYSLPRQLPDDSKLVDAWAKAHGAFELDRTGALRRLSRSEWLTAQREIADLSQDR